MNTVLNFSSLDFVVYAYLKEEIINTPDTPAVKYLKESCPKLMAFVNFMDSKFENDGMSKEMAKKINSDGGVSSNP